MPPEEDIYDLAELFKTFGDSTRMRILFVLLESEACVCGLASVTAIWLDIHGAYSLEVCSCSISTTLL